MSESQLETELDHPRLRSKRCGCDLTEGRAAIHGAGHLEGWRICQVKCICPELELVYFTHRKILERREIRAEKAVAENVGQGPAGVSVAVRRRRRECCRIKPLGKARSEE